MSCRPLDVFPLIAASVGTGGICPADGENFSEDQQQEMLVALNQMLPMLMKRLDAKGTLARWEVPVCSGVFSLPIDCVDVRQAFLCGYEITQRDQWFEGRMGHKLASCALFCGSGDLIDIGDGYAIPEVWPAHIQDTRFGVMAQNDQDAGKPVQVRFLDRYGNEKEETLTLLPNQQVAKTSSAVTDVKFIHKGLTAGAVIGYVTFNQTKNDRIVRIPANVPRPSFHRKKLPLAFGQCSGELSIIGKMRFTPLVEVTDPLPICDELALSFGLQALTALKNRNHGEYVTALGQAISELLKEMADVQPSAAVTQMQVISPMSFGNRCWS